ncbi:MAG: hypothetical protein EAZ47_05020 [Bacteroidetes bacterium]|nr:MAG: hypothetical protein EAY72_01495 [Bacteroidota bacterium]TAE68536.1 MAG: hypothetical protein EAY68_04410 [Bacteroidota bacterium]TAF93986.1 MAG: hypothetical protein EAZ47_05020 [Bacteroidota bacterium]
MYHPQVDAYIEGLPDHIQPIAEKVRQCLHACVPNIQERLSFNIPFYHLHGMFAYCGNTKEGYEISLAYCTDLLEVFPQLYRRNRKLFVSLLFQKKSDIVTQELELVLLSAVEIHAERHLSKQQKTKKKASTPKR